MKIQKKQRTIRLRDIHPQLRLTGGVIRLFMPKYLTEEMLRRQNAFTDKHFQGRWFGRHTKIEPRYIYREDGTKLRVLICTSKKGTKPNATGLLWIHGGGYAVGIPEQDYLRLDELVKDGTTVAVLPDYIKTTEKPYPAALEDCYLALKWLKEYAEELNVNENQLFVGGASAGGALTAAVSLYARDKKEVAIAFQMPLYPMLDDRTGTELIIDNDAPVWNSENNKRAWEMLLKGVEKSEGIPDYAAPTRAMDLIGLPPACTFVGSIEPFCDETISYFKRLKEQGVKTYIRIYKGCFHAFDINCYSTKIAKSARSYLLRVYRHAQKNFFAEQVI